MRNKNPWEEFPNIWKSEAAFITWIRGGLRKLWSKHPVKLEFMKANRKRIKNPNPTASKRFPEVWGAQCNVCKKDFVQNDIQIDHKGDEGTFTTLSEIEAYARHLYMVGFEDLQSVCKPCHKIINHSQRTRTSFEQAAMLKEVIRIFKEESKDDIMQFILDYYFLEEYNVSNEKSRKEAVKDIFEKFKWGEWCG